MVDITFLQEKLAAFVDCVTKSAREFLAERGKEVNYDRLETGQRLKKGIKDSGMTVQEFATAAGLTKNAVDNWIVGRSGMTLENACAVCDRLGWPLDRLVGRAREDAEAAETDFSGVCPQRSLA